MNRYEIRQGPLSEHCYFSYTVVDTQKPISYRGVLQTDIAGNPEYEIVCECFDEEAAKLVCDALNKEAACQQ